jgi:hypothetical protein
MSSSPAELSRAAKAAVVATLEELAFASIEEGAEAPPPSTALCWASIGVRGCSFARLTLAASLSLARQLAANIQGLDEVSDAQAIDTMAEAANTACGSLARAANDVDFHLMLPETGIGAMPQGAQICLDQLIVDGMPLWVRVESE